MKYYTNTFYVSIWEEFVGSDGNPSIYSRMFGNGYLKCDLMEDFGLATKSKLKEEVEKILLKITSLNDFTIKETNYGWVYERFVKWLDEDGFEYEIVPEGQHSDHEVYRVEISYISEDTGIFKYLKD